MGVSLGSYIILEKCLVKVKVETVIFSHHMAMAECLQFKIRYWQTLPYNSDNHLITSSGVTTASELVDEDFKNNLLMTILSLMKGDNSAFTDSSWSKLSTFSLSDHLHSPISIYLPQTDSETTSSSIDLSLPTDPHHRLASLNNIPSISRAGTACRQRDSQCNDTYLLNCCFTKERTCLFFPSSISDLLGTTKVK